MPKRKTEYEDLRRWTREELGAIIGAPMDVRPVILAALLGETTADVRARVRYDPLLGGVNVAGHLNIRLSSLTTRLGAKYSRSHKMLRAGKLVDRPSLPAAEIVRRFPDADMTIADAMAITGQTQEEVLTDVHARRLWANAGFRPRWTIWAPQFAEDHAGGHEI